MIGWGCVDFGEREKQLLDEVFKSRQITHGPFLDRFESNFAQMHGCRFGIMVNSGTSALRIALLAMKELDGWQDGDEVIVPALTYISTVNVVIQSGLKPVFVDVDSTTYNIDVSKIEEKITNRTRCTVPVHMFGLPTDMEQMRQIAHRHKLRILEDSCEAMGVSVMDRSVGSWGNAGAFSTYVAHIITTGVGGIMVTNDQAIYEVALSIANHGRNPGFLGSRTDWRNTDPKDRFRFDRLGYSFRSTQMEAALGLGQLERLPFIVEKRQKNAAYLTGLLKEVPAYQLPVIPDHYEHAFMMYPVVVHGMDTKRVVSYVESQGIETRPLMPLLNQPVYVAMFGDQSKEYPIAHALYENGFFVGCHQLLKQEELDLIADALKKAVAT